jgi:hypothetical protein
MTTVTEVLSDGFESPRIARVIHVFGQAAVPSGSAVVYDTVASGITYSEPIDLIGYNNIACEASVVLGSGTTCVDLTVEFSSDENGTYRPESTVDHSINPTAAVMVNLPRRFQSSDGFTFPITWPGLRWIRFGQAAAPDCLPAGSMIALSMTAYKTDV